MLSSTIRRAGAAAALSLAGLTGCLDSTGPDAHEEPDIGGIAVTAAPGGTAGGFVTVTGTTAAGTLTLRRNANNALTVQVLGTDAEDEPVVMEHFEEFEVQVFLDNALVATTTNTGYPYALTLNPGAATGTFNYTVIVRSLEHEHTEFTGSMPVTIAAQ